MMDNNGNVIVEMKPTYLISDVVSSVTDPHLLCDALVRRCKISNVSTEEQLSTPIPNCIMEDGLLQGDRSPNGSTHVVSMVKSSSAKSNLSPQRLAKVFDISLDDAIETLRVTERLLPRNTVDILLNKRYNHDNLILRYKRSKWPLYTDTPFASGTRGKTASRRRKVGTLV